MDTKRPLYMISVVSEMLRVHPQTLRIYEKEGLICPSRVSGQRLYSDEDVTKLRLILDLTRRLGVNRAGVDIILRMRHRMAGLQDEMQSMMEHLEEDLKRDFQEKIRKVFEEEEE
jgi:MerR family transcriptional regulator/heat shock protein HspR